MGLPALAANRDPGFIRNSAAAYAEAAQEVGEGVGVSVGVWLGVGVSVGGPPSVGVLVGDAPSVGV
jgi:hypothetical protein